MTRGTLEERFWAKVDKTSTCWFWRAAINPSGYGKYAIGTKAVRAHRFSYEMANGPIPNGLVIDHMCHVKHCVNPAHLRAITQKQNSEHHLSGNKGSTNPYRGVAKHGNRWLAQAKHLGEVHYGGVHTTPEEAAEAARQLRLSLYTHNDADRVRP